MREVLPAEAEPVGEIDYLHVGNNNPELAELWRRHIETPSDQALNDLVAGYQWLSRSVARKAMGMMYHQLGLGMDRDDLISLANMGILEALQRYQPNAGVAFTTFARRRVWGQVIDEMRKLSLVKRGAYERLKETGEVPKIKNFQDLGGGSADPRRRWDDWSDWEERFMVRQKLEIEADREQTQEIMEVVERFLRSDKITDRERKMVDLHYFGGVPMHEVGRRHGVTEARVSQILKGVRQRVYVDLMRELPYTTQRKLPYTTRAADQRQ